MELGVPSMSRRGHQASVLSRVLRWPHHKQHVHAPHVQPLDNLPAGCRTPRQQQQGTNGQRHCCSCNGGTAEAAQQSCITHSQPHVRSSWHTSTAAVIPSPSTPTRPVAHFMFAPPLLVPRMVPPCSWMPSTLCLVSTMGLFSCTHRHTCMPKGSQCVVSVLGAGR